MRLSNLKRITKEDFTDQDQDFIDKLGGILNPLLEQLSNGLNKNITIENLSREFITTTLEVDSNGVPKSPSQFKFSLATRIVGLHLIRVENLVNPGAYPSTAPFVHWSLNANIITIQKVNGLSANNKYRLTIELIS
jgi:hypothetical protein